MSRILERLRSPEPFGKAGLTVAILALVLATTGAAFAAVGLNSKQKKEVTAIAKKYAGKNGTNGTNGAPGEKGAQGLQGEKGEKGDTGNTGSPGTSVTNTAEPAGANCTNGGSKFVGTGTTYACNGTNGTNGTNGANATFEYLFNSATSGDPTSKKLALNAAPGSATEARISETDNEGTSGTNIAAAIASWVSGPATNGTLMVRKVSSQSTYALYTIEANKDEGAFDALKVKFLAGNGSFANSDPITVQYYASAATTLPMGQTERGEWAMSAGAFNVGYAPVSFGLPLSAAPTVAYVNEEGKEAVHSGLGFGTPGTPTHCLGSAAQPKAAEGFVCFYAEVEGTTLENARVNPFGASLNFKEGIAYGTWAVTG